jgi:hypothetical protein
MGHFNINIENGTVYWQLCHTCRLALADLLKHFDESIIHKVHIFIYFLINICFNPT